MKIIFDKEQPIKESDKKFKYVLALMRYDCGREVIWFVDGEVYDKDGNVLQDALTVFVPVDLKNISGDAPERKIWKFVCDYKKTSPG